MSPPDPLPRWGKGQGEGEMPPPHSLPTPLPPLDGIRVCDLTGYIAGSYAAMMLAGLGAAVVKVESLRGDAFRELPGFYGWTRGKRSVAVTLKAAEGRALAERLA